MDTTMRDTTAISLPALQHVLVATDFSQASSVAFQTAVSLARNINATLTILHVFEYADVPLGQEDDLPETRKAFEDVQRSMNTLLREAEAAGIAVETRIVGGLAAATIVDILNLEHIDLAVLGTKAIHGLERLVFGSVAETVLRQSTCPVLTAGPHAAFSPPLADPSAPVIFATDFHCTTTAAAAYATSFCSLTNSVLHCIHVLPRSLKTHGTPDVIPQILAGALSHVVEECGTLARKPVYTVTYGNEVSNAIVEYAQDHHAKLIVLGVRQASLMAAHIPAHITYRIITEAPCPVLTIAFDPNHESMYASGIACENAMPAA